MWNKIAKCSTHQGSITSLSISPDNTKIVVGTSTGYLSLFDIQCNLIASQKVHNQGINAVQWVPNGLAIVSASDDSTIKLSNQFLSTIKVYSGHQNAVMCIDVCSNSTLLASGGLDTSLLIWDITNETPIRTILAHSEAVCCIHFNSSGSYILTSSWDGLTRLWDVNTELNLRTYITGNVRVSYSLFSPNEAYILSSYMNNQIVLFETISQKPVALFKNHKNTTYNAITAFVAKDSNPESVEVVIGDEDGAIIGYNLNSQQIIWKIDVATSSTPVFQFNSTGLLLVVVSGNDDKVLEIFSRK